MVAVGHSNCWRVENYRVVGQAVMALTREYGLLLFSGVTLLVRWVRSLPLRKIWLRLFDLRDVSRGWWSCSRCFKNSKLARGAIPQPGASTGLVLGDQEVLSVAR